MRGIIHKFDGYVRLIAVAAISIYLIAGYSTPTIAIENIYIPKPTPTPALFFDSTALLYIAENATGYRAKNNVKTKETSPLSDMTVYPNTALIGLDFTYNTQDGPVYTETQTEIFITTIIPLRP